MTVGRIKVGDVRSIGRDPLRKLWMEAHPDAFLSPVHSDEEVTVLEVGLPYGPSGRRTGVRIRFDRHRPPTCPTCGSSDTDAPEVDWRTISEKFVVSQQSLGYTDDERAMHEEATRLALAEIRAEQGRPSEFGDQLDAEIAELLQGER